MSQELYYTSAPRGLQAGKSGFCTVAATRQMGAALMERLESLSSYRPLFPPHHPQAALNPVTHSYLRISVGGRSYSLLSRIGAAGLDYSGRTNLFAHHIVLDLAEQSAGGPAWLLQQDALRLNGDWQGEPRYLEPRTLPRGDVVVGPCQKWKRVMGDAGWGGVLAERFEKAPSEVVYLIFEPGFDPLPLLAESLMLLPPERRWDVTFSTYFTALPPGVPCVWRCVANGSEEAKKVARLPGTINLCVPAGPASGGDRVEQARTGKMPRRKAPVAPVQVSPSPLPHPVRLPEPMPEEKVAFQPERSRSRVWPFLVGMLAGIILTACASGVAGYFFAVQPWMVAEDTLKKTEETRKNLKDENTAQTNAIKDKVKEIAEEKKHWQDAENARKALDKELKEVRSKVPEEVKVELKRLLSNRSLLEEPLNGDWEKANTTKEMGSQFFVNVEAVAKRVFVKKNERLVKEKEIQDKILAKIEEAMEKLEGKIEGKVTISKAIKSAKTDRSKIDDISTKLTQLYKKLCTFGIFSLLEEWYKCERDFKDFKERFEKLEMKKTDEQAKKYFTKVKDGKNKMDQLIENYEKIKRSPEHKRIVEMRKKEIEDLIDKSEQLKEEMKKAKEPEKGRGNNQQNNKGQSSKQ